MKTFVSSWVLAVVLIVPTALTLITVELLNSVPARASHNLVRTRRALMAIGIILLIAVALVVIARFHYLRT